MSVSVLMPMRDAAAFVRQAIESVLSQDHASIELIVVDDGSTDGSGNVVSAIADPRIRLLDGPREGIAACLNFAIASASGAILMRCDADDLYPQGRIARQVAWLQAHAEHAAVCGPFSTMDRSGRSVSALGPWPDQVLADASLWIRSRRLSTHLCSFAIRREAVRVVGGFRGFFETAEDIDFQLRLAQHAPIAYLPMSAYLYRLHNASITHTQTTPRRRFFENAAYAMAIERERCGSDAVMRGELSAPPPADSPNDARAHSADAHVAALLIGEAWQCHARGDVGCARTSAWRALRADPRSWAAWKTLALIWLRVPTSGTAPR